MSIDVCESCFRHVDTDEDTFFYGDDGALCEWCRDEQFEAQVAYWRPLYEGEKQAGLLPANHYPAGRS